MAPGFTRVFMDRKLQIGVRVQPGNQKLALNGEQSPKLGYMLGNM